MLLSCRDMQKPITVLTGLDYWLDNLMCNVPELAMCFHLNGIVQVQASHIVYILRLHTREVVARAHTHTHTHTHTHSIEI